MTDAGFFRGTSADQDNRFANKQKKLLKELNFSPILNTKLNMSKINVENLKPWIETKIKEVLEKDDELLSESIYEHLAEKEPDGKSLLVLITGFVDAARASKFMEELWSKLIDLQENSNGVNKTANDEVELKSRDDHNNEQQQRTTDKQETSNVELNESKRGKSSGDHRGYGETQLLPRHHSPGPINKVSDLRASPRSTGSIQPRPSGSGLHSPPSSDRRRHKKDKKHKHKHKKSSKKHSRDRDSESSDRKRKKHKKHKKTKKHR